MPTARARFPWRLSTPAREHERATLKLLVARATVRVRGFLEQPPRLAVIATSHRVPAEHDQRPAHSPLVVEFPEESECLVPKAVADLEIALHACEHGGGAECPRARESWSVRGSGERSRQPFPPLPKVTAPLPGRHQPASQLERKLRLDLEREVERDSEVLALLLQPVEIVVSEQRLVEGVVGRAAA